MQAVKLTKDHPELQLPQWKTFNPDKLIHLRGTLEKRGLSQALTRKGGGECYFSFSAVSRDQGKTLWDTPTCCRVHKWGPGETDKVSKG